MNLDDSKRGALYRLSLVLCSLALVLMPLAARSSMSPMRATDAAVLPAIAAHRAPSPNATLSFSGDPFEPPSDSTAKAVPARDIVRAVVLGERPQALIEDSGQVRLIQLNSPVGGSRVVEIDEGGVILADGAVLRLADDGPH